MFVANDPCVKAGTYYPITVKKVDLYKIYKIYIFFINSI
jgi:hypothetical protein